MFRRWSPFSWALSGLGFALSLQSHSGEVYRAGQLPQILHELETKYSASKTLKAKFVQSTVSAITGAPKKSEGTLEVKRPDKIRWETLAPDKSLLVSDGKKAWFYTPPFDSSEPGQVYERKSSSIQSKLAHALLAGRFSVAKDMTIEAKGAFKFLLKPKSAVGGSVKEALIEINPSARVIEHVEIVHKGGNRTDIRLSEIQLGQELPDSGFVFVPPAGTIKLKN